MRTFTIDSDDNVSVQLAKNAMRSDLIPSTSHWL